MDFTKGPQSWLLAFGFLAVIGVAWFFVDRYEKKQAAAAGILSVHQQEVRYFDCEKAIACVRGEIVANTGGPTREQKPVSRFLAPGLRVYYVLDSSGQFTYLRGMDIEHQGLDEARLHQIGIENLKDVIEGDVQYIELGKVWMARFDGNCESSLLLLDYMWDKPMTEIAPNGFVVGVPTRDVLLIADKSNSESISELRERVASVLANPSVEYVVSNRLYVWETNQWSVFE